MKYDDKKAFKNLLVKNQKDLSDVNISIREFAPIITMITRNLAEFFGSHDSVCEVLAVVSDLLRIPFLSGSVEKDEALNK